VRVKHLPRTNVDANLGLRSLEGIKDKAQLLLQQSGDSGTTGQAEKGGDVTAMCDLADDLRDVIVEYQVSTNAWEWMRDGSLIMRFVARATGGNLRAEL